MHFQPLGSLSSISTAGNRNITLCTSPPSVLIVLFATNKRTFRHTHAKRALLFKLFLWSGLFFAGSLKKKEVELNVCCAVCLCVPRIKLKQFKSKAFQFYWHFALSLSAFRPRPPSVCLLASIRLLSLHLHNSAPMSHFS